MSKTNAYETERKPSSELLNLSKKICSMQLKINELENELKPMKVKATNMMYDEDFKTITAGNLGTLTLVDGCQVSGFDKKKLQIENPKIYEKYKTTSFRDAHLSVSVNK